MTPLLTLLAGVLLGLVLGLVLGRLSARRDEALVLSSVQGLAAQAVAGSRAEAERDGATQRAAVASLITPLSEQLALVEAQLRALEVARAGSGAELREQVAGVQRSSELLGRETAALVDALRRPQARGVWGELQLRRCVELAGMVEHCDFDEQVVLPRPDGGTLRPDLVVHLAGGRSVVVDAKVTLAAYLEAAEADSEREASARMAAHARHLRAHVDRLADRCYSQALPDSPEFVVLFVPGEAFLSPALEHDPALLEHALTRRVHLATPTTLVSLLRTVAHGWQQSTLTESARAVVAAGKELYERLGTYGAHVDKLGRSLGTVVADYNKAVGSLERTLLPSARRLAELGAGPESVDVPTTVDALPRPLSAPELAPLRSAG